MTFSGMVLRVRLLSAVLITGCLLFILVNGVAAAVQATKTGKPTPEAAPDVQVHSWFLSQGVELAKHLEPYLPEVTAPLVQREFNVGTESRVKTWSEAYLQGIRGESNLLKDMDMWVAPVTWGTFHLGVIVYVQDINSLSPSPLPAEVESSEPKASEGVPQPTRSTATGMPNRVIEPKNSHLPVFVNQPGFVYVLPDLARSLTSGTEKNPNIPIYDPAEQAWFSLQEDELVAVSDAARERVCGRVSLVSIQDAVQSWWGIVEAAPTQSSQSIEVRSQENVLWVVVLAVVVVAVALLVVWLMSKIHSRGEENEVQPLPDSQLIIVASPPKTSAIPTMSIE